MKPCSSCGTSNADSAQTCTGCNRPFAAAGVVPGEPRLDATSHGAKGALDLIAGRYQLVEQLGKGGAGVVYRARDAKLGEEIALKILQASEQGAEQGEIDRFKREIITARKITHPAVIRIHDFGESGKDVFISMELLSGGTLTRKMKEGLPLGKAIEIAMGICEGLQAAHDLGVIHRDLKPDNVLFDSAGRPKLADFGLARLAHATTKTIGFSGTPYYMSPEHANGSDVTFASDIYSIGVVFYQMFTGRLPFLADNFLRLVSLHCTEPATPMRETAPELPVELDAIILRCLEKNPEDRYASAADVADALRDVRQSLRRTPQDATVIRRNPDLGSAASLRSSASERPVSERPVSVRPAAAREVTADAPAARRAAPKAGVPMWFLGVGGVMLLFVGFGAMMLIGGMQGTAKIEVGGKPTSTPFATVAPTQAIVIATATPAATPPATARPVTTIARATATPRPTARPTEMVAVVRPTPVVAVAKDASLKVTGDSFFEVIIDGKSYGSDVPMKIDDLKPGTHELKLWKKSSSQLKREFVTLKAGQTLVVHFNTKKGTIKQAFK